MEIILFVCINAIGIFYLCFCSLKSIQILQLEGYRTKGFWSWLFCRKNSYFLRLVNLAMLVLLSTFVFLMLFGQYEFFNYIGFLFFIAFCQIFVILYFRETKKTPLKFTPRATRLFFASTIIFGVLMFLSTYFTMELKIAYLISGVLPLFIPFVVIAANIILYPLERLICWYYVKKAQKKLAQKPDMKIIGITGSFGKTTVRAILTELLSTTYKTGSTIHSYNTPMGICKLVNDKNQALDYDYFVAEMGARYRKDIKELCDLLRPNFAIITGIGKQHLETFKTEQNIADTKYDLVKEKREGGFSAFNCTLEATKALYDKTPSDKIAVAEKGTGDGFYAYYSDISTSAEGSIFNLEIDGKKEQFCTALLGAHNVSNIALCIAVAYKLGVPLDRLKEAVLQLKPVAHRLELVKDEGGLTIIDDAYNANSQGAKAAFEVLAAFEETKIVITPGIVEMGNEAQSANIEFGRAAAKACDYAYLLGANAEAIKKGLEDEGFDSQKIVISKTLDEAVKDAAKIEGKKVILFENDLPDNL